MHLTYSEHLPVIAHRDEIIRLLKTEQVIVVAGDTGSGKSTQLPKFCLEALPESKAMIGCTQPRRVAAASISDRVSEELGPLGAIVGYKIRFHDQTTPRTKIKFMTDGVLLAETGSDPLLRRYQAIILDEAHERSLNIDFILGILHRILPKRPDLKLIITSATIDTSVFAAHFSKAPVVNIQGRTYPVQVRYLPVPDDQFHQKDGYIEHCVQSIVDLVMTEPPGDILTFLPTERDIRTCCELLEGRIDNAIILPIFGRLQAADQRRIFLSFKQTKIVIATNIAETSITVPGIRYVVDSGLARIATYNVRARTTSLPVTRISQASCEQRKGRSGRVGPGICLRLYSEDDYLNRSAYTLPEIRRSNLAAVVLQMLSLKLGDPFSFPFIDPPHPNAVRDAFRLLAELGALDGDRKLTRYGRIMATMPIDPCIARIIIEAGKNGSLKEIRVIASAIAIQDPRVRPADMEKQADEAHQRFAHPRSDFLCLLNIWNLFHEVRDQVRSWSRLKKFCKTHFLSFQRMREWLDLHEQIGRILTQHSELSENTAEGSYQMIHSALASGFLRNIAVKKKDKTYQGTGGRELMIFPGSQLFAKGGQWIIAAAFIETSRLYAVTVAAIEPEWLEIVGRHLCATSWSHPRWEKKRGQVIADEKVTLFGLPIVASRRVNFGRRHPGNRNEARSVFIEQALLTGELGGVYPFLQHNLDLIAGWKNTERRLRKHDILVDDSTIIAFYDKLLGNDVYDRYTLNRFLKKNSQQSLMMTDSDIVQRTPQPDELVNFPTSLIVGSLEFKLDYDFEPGSDRDGVTVRIPAAIAPTLKPEVFQWLVPGLLQEKTLFLLKGLPKNIRKQFIPLSHTVDLVLDSMMTRQGSYYQTLERGLFKLFKKTVRRSDWPTTLPDHLRMRFALFDTDGTVVASGRDLQDLIAGTKTSKAKPLSRRLNSTDEALILHWKDRIVRQWDFADLPERILLYSGRDKEVAGYLYPAVCQVQEKDGVTINFEPTSQVARLNTAAGMIFLYRLQFPDQFKALKRLCTTRLSGPSSLWLVEGLGGAKNCVDDLLNFILQTLFSTGSGTIPGRQEFEETIQKMRSRGLYQTGSEIFETVMALLRRRREVKEQIRHYENLSQKSRSYSQERHNEYLDLLEEILPNDFLSIFSIKQLENCDRYLKSLIIRIERAHADPSKELGKKKRLHPHLQRLERLRSKSNDLGEDCLSLMKEYEELLNEFRISLFSPEVGTRLSVSDKKLDRHWQKINESC